MSEYSDLFRVRLYSKNPNEYSNIRYNCFTPTRNPNSCPTVPGFLFAREWSLDALLPMLAKQYLLSLVVQRLHHELPILPNQYFADRQRYFELERNLA